jgi:hypothetical protein
MRNAEAQKCYANLRSAIGVVYAWRAEKATSQTERERMTRESEFAFKQTLALNAYTPKAVWPYVDMLLGQDRVVEAGEVADTAAKVSAGRDKSLEPLLERVRTASMKKK